MTRSILIIALVFLSFIFAVIAAIDDATIQKCVDAGNSRAICRKILGD